MRKLITILFIFIITFAQSQDMRSVDWKFIVSDVVLINTDTFQIEAIPIDFNDKGAIDRIVGNYIIDFVARCYKVIDSTSTTLTVVDLASENIAPQSERIARCYQSVLDGNSRYVSIGGVDVSVIDELSRWKDIARNNELFARAIASVVALTMPFDTVTLNTSYTETGNESVGTRYWNPDDNTTNLVLPNGVVLQDGHELFFDVLNQTGSTLTNGYVAAYGGVVGASAKIKAIYGIADGSMLPEAIIGVFTESIPNGEQGKSTWFGKVRGISTDGSVYGETWSDGDTLWVSPYTAGYLTNAQPNAPFPSIFMAVVASAHSTNGTLIVRPSFPETLASLSDVNGTPLDSSGQFPVWNNGSSYFDFDHNINDYVPDSIFNNIIGAFRLFGGQITTNGDGTVNVAAGGGIIKADEAGPEDIPTAINEGQGSDISYLEWNAVSSMVLTDDAYNYIYLDGTDSVMKSTTNFYSISFTQDFTVGRAYRDGNDVVARLCGTNAWNFNRRVQLFGEEVFPIIRGTGLIIGATGTLQFSITSGIIWAELVNRFSIDAFDGATTSFKYWYEDGLGDWTSSASTLIDNQHWDDGTGTLNTLTPNRYGVHWVYIVHDGSVHVVYGQGDYTLAGSLLALIPSPKPGLLEAYATLVGKIIIKKSETSFYQISSAFDEVFSSQTVSDHNSLSGLDGGEAGYYGHLATAEQLSLDTIGINASDISDLQDTTIELRADINTSLNQTWQDVIDNGTATVTNTIVHAAPSLSTESALLSDVEALGVGDLTDGYLPNATGIILEDSKVYFDGTNIIIKENAILNRNLTLFSDISLTVNPGASTFGGVIQSASSGHLLLDLRNNDNADAIAFRYSSTNSTTIDAVGFAMKGTGNILINTTTDNATDKLQVNGSISATKIKLTTSPTVDYVLTSDASGNGTWQAATGGTTPTINEVYAQSADATGYNPTFTTANGSQLKLYTTNAGAGAGGIVFYDETPTLQFEVGYNNNSNESFLWSHNDLIKFGSGGLEKLVINTTGQIKLNSYTSTTSFPGTAVANIQVDISGNIITTAVPSTGTADYVSNVTFATATGVLDFTGQGNAFDSPIDLDGRYIETVVSLGGLGKSADNVYMSVANTSDQSSALALTDYMWVKNAIAGTGVGSVQLSDLQTLIGVGLTDPMTTRGDIIYRNSSNITARLPIGANTYVLTSDGTDVGWEAEATGIWTDGGTYVYPANSEDVLIGSSTDAGSWKLQVTGSMRLTTNLRMGEIGSIATPASGFGEWWIDNGDNLPYFTNDNGDIFDLTDTKTTTVSTSTSIYTQDYIDGHLFFTLNENITLNIENIPDGGEKNLFFKQDASGSRTLTLVLKSSSTTLTQTRASDQIAINSAANSLSKITYQRFGNNAFITYQY